MALLLACNLAGCTGYVDAASLAPEPVPQNVAKASRSSADRPHGVVSSSKLTNDLASVAPSAAWSGAVGTWCGPVDQQTIWLSVGTSSGTCDAASKKVYSSAAEDASEGLTVELDPLQLATFPIELVAPARYCSARSGTCSDVQVSLDIESFTADVGLQGRWSIAALGQSPLAGPIDAGWCNWDAFLPAHPAAEDRLARDIKIEEVSVYQGVKVPIVRDLHAVAARNADLVQGREALVRVFVTPAPEFQSRELSARVTLQDDGKKPRYFEQIVNVSGASEDSDGKSTFNIELPKDAFNDGTQYSVELRETSRCTALSGTPAGARFPEQGLAPVGARATGPVKVMVVPVRYDTDGSGRLPDTSTEQLSQMAKLMYAMYPTTDVELSVHDVVGTTAMSLDDMLDQMRELRIADAVPNDLAYYGMVEPTDTFSDYCQGACTTGIAGFGSQSGTAAAGMGVGFTETAASTFVHEVGHIYRRAHAPCGGAASPDENYPYPDAGIGSWGYNVQTRELFDPQDHVDFMSYCSPTWISDYNYQQILERIVVVNRHPVFRRTGTPPAPRTFRTLRIAKNGQAHFGLDIHPQLEPPGDPVTVKALDAQGLALQDVSAFFEAGPDGEAAYFIPAGHADWQAIQVPGAPPIAYAEPTRNVPFLRQ